MTDSSGLWGVGDRTARPDYRGARTAALRKAMPLTAAHAIRLVLVLSPSDLVIDQRSDGIQDRIFAVTARVGHHYSFTAR
ncbi:hypothetical protein D2E76_16160 [Mycobacteroides abscessus]|uniref:Uncharacterized protein n=1 Tax=Mycobacteroides abscessus TaxID=36809 RepID=A0ABD7HNH0_9MYCO|nr:hypothetical protein D2E76_16160 [Mycobacteroides abscessus]